MSRPSRPASPWPGYMSRLAARRLRFLPPRNRERPDLVPVVIGNDFGSYGIARCFHQAYGTRVALVCSEPLGCVRESRFIDLYVVADLGNSEVLLNTLRAIREDTPNTHRLIVGTYPGLMCFLSHNRAKLEGDYAFPISGPDAMRAIMNKAEFASCCAEAHVPVPYTQRINIRRETPVSFDIPFPVLASASVWHTCQTRKVCGASPSVILEGPADAMNLWRKLEEVGYEEDVIIEPLSSHTTSPTTLLTFYVNSHGNATLAASLQVLLSSPNPRHVGVPLAVLTQIPDARQVDYGLAIVRASGYRGFVTFTIREDPDTGGPLFVDAVATGGRLGFAMQAGGINPMRHLVADLIDGAELRLRHTTEQRVVTAVPPWYLLRHIRSPHLRRVVREAVREGRWSSPLTYGPDQSWRKTLTDGMNIGETMMAFATGRAPAVSL